MLGGAGQAKVVDVEPEDKVVQSLSMGIRLSMRLSMSTNIKHAHKHWSEARS
jgi:hypothetical protein